MKISEVILTVIIIVLFASVSIFLWNLKRKINYNISYKSMVEQTVKDMVKPESLKENQ